MECLAVAAAAGPVRCHVHRRAAYAFRRAGTVHAAADRHAGQSGGDRLGGDPGGQAARVRRGIRDGQGRLDLAGSQSPEQVGRAIAALADDLDLLNLTRRALSIDAPAQPYRVDVWS